MVTTCEKENRVYYEANAGICTWGGGRNEKDPQDGIRLQIDAAPAKVPVNAKGFMGEDPGLFLPKL